MNDQVQRRLAAIVSADVVGYSRLMGADEVGTIAALREHRTSLIDAEIEKHGGRIVKTMGDGMLLEFPSVIDAVKLAVSVQEKIRLRNANVPEDQQIVFRIGINLGDIITDGDDILGDGVNIAARLEALAEPGGICISERVHDDVQDKLDIAFTDLGRRELKNIARPIRCWAWRSDVGRTTRSKGAKAFGEAPALAVLPFASSSQDPEYEFFASGLTEDLTTMLSSLRDFPVISHNSAVAFRGKDVDIADAARKLGASYIVEGSVRVAGRRMRVTAQLVDTSSGHQLWAQRFDRDVDDIFTLQDELSLQIASNISPTVGRAENARTEAASPEELSVWAALNRVRDLAAVADLERTLQAMKILQELEHKDAGNSMVAAYLANSVHSLMLVGHLSWRQGRKEVMKYALRAIEKDPANYMGHLFVGTAELYNGRFEAVLQAAQRVIELNPSASMGYFLSGLAKTAMGQAEDSLADYEMMERLSPLDPLLYHKHVGASRALFILGRYEEAAEAARQGVTASPNVPYQWLQLISSLALAEDVNRARSEAAKFRGKFPEISVADHLVHFTTRDPENLERFKDGLRLADLDVGT